MDTMWLVFGGISLIGCLTVAWLVGRKGYTEELNRLGKQQRRIQEKEESLTDQSASIFLQERTDFLGKLLAQAGLESQYDKMKQKWMMSAIGTTVAMFIFAWVQSPELMWAALFLGPALGAWGFIAYIKHLVKQRQAKMTSQLPQVLESMVSSLKAGSPIVECFKLLAETAPDPIRSEFRRSLVSLQLGKPFRDVMHEMSARIKTADFKLLTQAIFISQDVGANLADVVAVIAEAIRERFRLRDFLNSLTAQGKATAVFIGCLPYFITAMTYMMTPGYITPFLNHPIARMVFIGMIMWEGLGFWILLKMTTFEV